MFSIHRFGVFLEPRVFPEKTLSIYSIVGCTARWSWFSNVLLVRVAQLTRSHQMATGKTHAVALLTGQTYGCNEVGPQFELLKNSSLPPADNSNKITSQ